jgi:hypothetical protein
MHAYARAMTMTRMDMDGDESAVAGGKASMVTQGCTTSGICKAKQAHDKQWQHAKGTGRR